MALQIKTQKQLFKAYVIVFIVGSLIDLLVLYIDNKDISFRAYVDSAHVVIIVLMLQMYKTYIRDIRTNFSEKVIVIKRKSAAIFTWIYVFIIAISLQIVGSLLDKTSINWHRALGMVVVWTILFGLDLLIFSEYSLRETKFKK